MLVETHFLLLLSPLGVDRFHDCVFHALDLAFDELFGGVQVLNQYFFLDEYLEELIIEVFLASAAGLGIGVDGLHFGFELELLVEGVLSECLVKELCLLCCKLDEVDSLLLLLSNAQ